MWSEIGRLLTEKNLTLSVAESCTGGLISSEIVSVPGASAFFLLGVTAYSNDAKEKILGVRHETILRHGAVSREVAIEMAEGVRSAGRSDIGISSTGIAGPSGGTDEKPVGLVYLALSFRGETIVQKHVFEGDRRAIMKAASQEAGRFIRSFLEGEKTQ